MLFSLFPFDWKYVPPKKRLSKWQYADYFEDQRGRAFQRLLVSLKKRSDSLDASTTEAITLLTNPIHSLVTQKTSGMAQDDRLYYPNKFGWFIIKSLEEIIGKSSLEAVLNSSSLGHYVEKYPFENLDNLDKEFDFADISALCAALDDVYGVRIGNRIAHRVGRASYIRSVQQFGAIAGAADVLYAVLPFQTRLRIGLPAMAKVFSQLSDQYTVVEENSSEFVWIIHECPYCYKRTTDSPTCYMVGGFLSESIKWILGGKEVHLEEIKCKAVGDAVCEFLIQKKIK